MEVGALIFLEVTGTPSGWKAILSESVLRVPAHGRLETSLIVELMASLQGIPERKPLVEIHHQLDVVARGIAHLPDHG